MARAPVETIGQEGAIQLIVYQSFADEMKEMFKERDDLSNGCLTDGEGALGCRDCLAHRISDKNARPALANDEQVAGWELLFRGPDHGFTELFLHCPALATATASKAGNLPCQTVGLMPVMGT